MKHRVRKGLAASLVGGLSLAVGPLVTTSGLAAPPDVPAESGNRGGSRAGVTDQVDLGDAESERTHGLVTAGPTQVASGTVTAGQVTEEYTARQVGRGGRFEVELDVRRGQPLTVQLRELRPDDAWGETYGFRVYLDGRLAYVRDNTPDPGGGPYSSVFLDTHDRDALRDGTVTLTIEGTSDEPAYFTDVWAYSDLERMVKKQGMRVPDRLIFLLGQDYLGEATFREGLDYITENFEATEHVKLGFAVLDYFPNRSPAQMAANYRLWLELSREYDLPFAIEGVTDWEGTPVRVPDGKGGYFGDLEYQQILWSPQDQTGPDQDVYTNPDGEIQRLDELLGDAYEPKYGLSVPNVWGSTPWLTWRHPDLNAFYEKKANQSLGEIRPLVWDLQRTDELDRLLPFSTSNESVYWSKRDGVGVWDVVYTDYNGGVEREDIFADLNPYNVAAAAEDGVTLDPTDGWSDAEKRWLYQNQSFHQQMFADIFYAGLPRERIEVDGGRPEYPTDMLRHNIHSEIYSRMQEPYYSGVFPSITQGIVERARPGSQFITLDSYNPGGFYHLQKSREFGRIANPNLENSVSTHAPDKTLLLRQLFVNGSRYTTPYNWRMEGPDEATGWVTPFLADMHPWGAVHDPPPDGMVTGETVVSQTFTAGELRLVNRVEVKLERHGRPAALRLTLREGSGDGRVVGMRYLSRSEAPRRGWASFALPIVQLDSGQTYHLEIEQLDGRRPVYSYPTAGGDLLYRVGLDMLAERDRSLVIQWRRDSADAIANIAGELTPEDEHARGLLDEARQALGQHRYVEAYELAMRADSMRFPVLYQSTGRAHLDPFPLTVDSSAATNVDVKAFTEGRRLEFSITGYEAGTATVTVRHIADASVFIDRLPADLVRQGRRHVTFEVDLSDLGRHEVHVLAEGEEPPPPPPSEPPIVTGVDAAQPMFGGRDNTVSVTVDNTTNEDVTVTTHVTAPDGWKTTGETSTIGAQRSAELEAVVTPPDGPTPPATLEVEVTAEGHEVRDGTQQLDVIAVPHGDDVTLALDAGNLSSPVVESYQQLAPQHFFDPEFRDYGWVGNPPQSRDRGLSTGAMRRDFVNDVADRTLRITVPAGEHHVWMLVGDEDFAAAPTVVSTAGEVLGQSPPLAAGEYTWLQFPIDGGRTVDLQISGADGQHWHLNALVVTP